MDTAGYGGVSASALAADTHHPGALSHLYGQLMCGAAPFQCANDGNQPRSPELVLRAVAGGQFVFAATGIARERYRARC